MRVLYPGSFDPVTCGHVDLIRRAAGLFDEVVVAVLHNPAKRAAFTPEERVDMLRRVLTGLPNVRVASHGGLTADFAREIGAGALLRGVRTIGDFQSEQSMAELNERLCPGLETLCLFASPAYASVSSSAVREIAAFGGSLRGLVPEGIEAEVAARLAAQTH